MLKVERQNWIVIKRHTSGEVVVSPLAGELKVSEDTIRRDLLDLDQKGQLKRVFGGAIPLEKPVINFFDRETADVALKQQLSNSYSIAHVCSLKEQIRVIILGGNLLKDSMTTVGEVAAAQAAGYHPDLCFMGVYAIHPEYGMTIPYPEEVSIKRQLIRSSSRVIALVNPAKLNTVSRYQVCGIEDFTTLITDGHVPQEMASRYKNRGLDFL